MKLMYDFEVDTWSGRITGRFIASEKDIKANIGQRLLLSGADYTLFDYTQLNMLTGDQEFIEKYERLFGNETIYGFNPLDEGNLVSPDDHDEMVPF